MQKLVLKQLKKVWQIYNAATSQWMLFGAVLMLSLVFSVPKLYAQNWDINTLNNINPSNPSSKYWQHTSEAIYPLAIGIPAGVLIAGYINHDKDAQQKGWKIIGALAVNTIFTETFKYSVNRERPYDKYPLLINPYNRPEEGKSFPSGHTSTAFTLAASLSIQNSKWYVVVPAYAYASTVGYSRLYLGEHYPSDVLAGAALGVGSAYLSNWIAKKVFNTKK